MREKEKKMREIGERAGSAKSFPPKNFINEEDGLTVSCLGLL